MSRIADGVPEMLKAVRDELRKGADQIKLMVSGGVASQSDPLESLQFRVDEIEAAVEQASHLALVRDGACVFGRRDRAARSNAACARSSTAISSTQPAARQMAERGAYIVPTLVTYDSLKRHGPGYGLTAYSLEKNRIVLDAGLRSLELCRAAGVRIGFGTDLLGQLQDDQCTEFLIRAEVMTPQEIIHSATVVNAEIVQRAGQLGELVAGRLCRSAGGRRRSVSRPQRAAGPGRAHRRDHEGRSVVQEPDVNIDQERNHAQSSRRRHHDELRPTGQSRCRR